MASNKTYWKSMDQLNPSDKDLDNLGKMNLFQNFLKIFQVTKKRLTNILHLEEIF